MIEFAPIGANSFRVDHILGRLRTSCKQTGSHESCLPLKTWRKKMAVYPYTLKKIKCISMDTHSPMCEGRQKHRYQSYLPLSWN